MSNEDPDFAKEQYDRLTEAVLDRYYRWLQEVTKELPVFYVPDIEVQELEHGVRLSVVMDFALDGEDLT